MDKRKDNQVLIKILCVISAFIFWLYVTAIENPISTMPLNNVAVEVINQDDLAKSKLTLLPNQDFTVNLTLKGPLSELKKVKKEQFKLQADIKGYVLRKGEYKIPVYLLQDAPGNIKVIDTYLYVELKLDDLAEKTVPVVVDLSYTTANGYKAINPPTANITSVNVSGPAQFVNTVSYVKAKSDVKNIEKDFSSNLELKAYNQLDKEVTDVVINPGSVDVLLTVNKTKTVGVNIRTKGTLKEGVVLTSPLEALPGNVEIAGSESALNNISALDTEIIDLSQISSNGLFDVKLVVPQGVSIISDKDTVSIKTTIDKISQKNFSLPIKYNNLGADYNISVDKDKVSLVVTGPENKLSTLTAETIKCYIELSNLTEGEGHTVPVTVSVPEGFTIVSKTPQNIKVTLIKNATPTTGNAGDTVATENPPISSNTEQTKPVVQ